MNETDAGAASPAIPSKKKNDHLSLDRKWKSFPNVPHLLQYVNTGAYFGKIRVNGKQIRQSLKTTVFSVAKTKLIDFINREQKRKRIDGNFNDAHARYLEELAADHTLSEGTKAYYRDRLKALLKSWPELVGKRIDAITESDCQDWAKRFSTEFEARNFNNTLSILRQIIEIGGCEKSANPAYKIQRLGVKPTELHLPDLDTFAKVIATVENAGARQSKDCADLIRFLAYSGCRISEARLCNWADVDQERGTLRIQNAKTRKRSGASAIRIIPMIAPLKEHLERLRLKHKPKPEDGICRVHDCERSLTNACTTVGVPRLTHHDMRHFFATRCIESGVDIQTVSRWLGHSDGGALAMKTYGHLRNEHSQAMAAKVKF